MMVWLLPWHSMEANDSVMNKVERWEIGLSIISVETQVFGVNGMKSMKAAEEKPVFLKHALFKEKNKPNTFFPWRNESFLLE